MPTTLKNTKGEAFKVGQEVICVSTRASGPACGLSDNMKRAVGSVMEINAFIDPSRKILRLKGNAWAWHLDDFASEGSALDNMLRATDLPGDLVKWGSLDPRLYKRNHTNNFYLFTAPKDRDAMDVTYKEIENSTSRYQTKYRASGDYYREQIFKGTGAVDAKYTTVHSCLGGFMGTFDAFRTEYKKRPTHCIQQMLFPSIKPTAREMGMVELPKGFQSPTRAHWKEYVDHMIRGNLLPDYLDTDKIFKSNRAVTYYFTLRMDNISKERWYFFASIIRNLGEYPIMIHAINGMLRDMPTMHPLTALCLAASCYGTRTHAAVETSGYFGIMNKYAVLELKDISQYVTRVAKFLTDKMGFKPLSEESTNFVMWRIFKLFRKQGSTPAGGQIVIKVRPPKKSYESIESLINYNPFTREVA